MDDRHPITPVVLPSAGLGRAAAQRTCAYGDLVAKRSPVRIAVVGVDGSAGSSAALDWARRAVGPDGAVHEVHADDDPAGTLLRAAADQDADIVVIGVHSQSHLAQSHLAPKRLGHVGKELITRTDRPVAVVGAGPSSGSSTVVAGVGHGDATRAALEWSAHYADTHGTAIELIRAIPNRPVFRTDGLLDVMAFYIDRDMAREWAMDDIRRLADEIQVATDEQLSITWSARRGGTGPTLVDASEGASLLVLGLHDSDRPDVAGWLHHALTHAPCPVVVVPATAQSDGRR